MKNKFIIITILSILTIISYSFIPNNKYSNLLINLLYILPPILAVIAGLNATNTYNYQNSHGKNILIMTLGLTLLCVGEILFVFYDIFLKQDPFPSIADIFYLLSFPFLFIGIFKEYLNIKKILKLRQFHVSQTTYIFAIIILICATFLSIFKVFNTSQPLIENIILISYGIGDVFLIGALIALISIIKLYHRGKMMYSWIYMILGIISILIADLLFALYNLEYETPGSLYKQIDYFWILGYYFIALCFWHQQELILQIQKNVKRF